MELSLTRTYEVGIGYVDNHNAARPSFLFDIMQDIATIHADALQIGIGSGLLWVLSRMQVTLQRPLRPYERLSVTTWCPGVKGPSWFRCFTFTVDGQPVGEAHSMWTALDPESHRILRPTGIAAAAPLLAAGEPGLTPLPKLSCDNATPHHVHTVRYADLDMNRHVNNAKVVDLIADALDLQQEKGFVSMLQVNYTAETRFGEAITLLTGEVDDLRYVRGVCADATHFEAVARLSAAPQDERKEGKL